MRCVAHNRLVPHTGCQESELWNELNELRARIESERADRIAGQDDIRRAVAHDLGELRAEVAAGRPACPCRPQPPAVGMV